MGRLVGSMPLPGSRQTPEVLGMFEYLCEARQALHALGYGIWSPCLLHTQVPAAQRRSLNDSEQIALGTRGNATFTQGAMPPSHRAAVEKAVDTEGLGRWLEWGQLGDICSAGIC